MSPSITTGRRQLRLTASHSSADRAPGPRQVRVIVISKFFTAKNNSDYIYYSKVNESGMESSSKNGSAKRKTSLKAQLPQGSKKYDGSKSIKSNSFHLARNTEKPIVENNGMAGYPQSCCDQSSHSMGSQSAHLHISNVELSHDPHAKAPVIQPDICSNLNIKGK
jgi:hypothetical protein